MEVVMAFVIGGLFAAAIFLMLQGKLVKLLIGLVLLSHASNLLIFVTSDLIRANPPLIDEGSNVLETPYADPIPQALILTAIVIAFALNAFTIALVLRVNTTVGTDDVDEITTTEY